MNSARVLAEKLLSSAFSTGASDIHFYPFLKETNIFFRVHGKRILHRQITASQYDAILTYFKFTSGIDIGETRKPQNGAISFYFSKKSYALRISTLPLGHKESLAIRILPQEKALPLDKLFLFPNQVNKLKAWMDKPAGIILLTGPTGSGKTTTLYALLQSIMEERTCQTITLEDPIEKKLDNIFQVQINEKAGITYQTGLKAALRHDPDIIMIGEIRDAFTAKFAFNASLTGHLVLSTLHAKDTVGTIHRLLDMGIKQIDLQQSLIGVASLQLLPITLNTGKKRRAAIMEFLDGHALDQSIKEKKGTGIQRIQSFHHLRKKAFAYGYIDQTLL
ncbi:MULTISPECIES: competence type IV pilus ATPase ComGA [unclassified Virgibacillus]|uniref:competence type IV pilus ATPase ComGA n=1 Tax=unclassified Virgibacillus TaxID=2620237 RepID=UPI0024DEAC69|nr:competence type IV pilus ATPase ComGA [Virgibacillus sp. LDC-1]